MRKIYRNVVKGEPQEWNDKGPQQIVQCCVIEDPSNPCKWGKVEVMIRVIDMQIDKHKKS